MAELNKEPIFCSRCGKQNSHDSIHTCSPQYQIELREKYELGYRRYEAVRKMNVSQFQALFKKSLVGEQSFDDLVDEITAKEYK